MAPDQLARIPWPKYDHVRQGCPTLAEGVGRPGLCARSSELIGYVYIITNSADSSVVKVGRTNNLKRRLKEHNSYSSVVGQWGYVWKLKVPDMEGAERRLHKVLLRWKAPGRREQFKMSIKAAIEAAEIELSEFSTYGAELKAKRAEETRKRAEKLARQAEAKRREEERQAELRRREEAHLAKINGLRNELRIEHERSVRSSLLPYTAIGGVAVLAAFGWYVDPGLIGWCLGGSALVICVSWLYIEWVFPRALEVKPFEPPNDSVLERILRTRNLVEDSKGTDDFQGMQKRTARAFGRPNSEPNVSSIDAPPSYVPSYKTVAICALAGLILLTLAFSKDREIHQERQQSQSSSQTTQNLNSGATRGAENLASKIVARALRAAF